MAKRKAKKVKRTQKKKAPRKNRGKNPGLKSNKFSRIKQEFFDQDYIDQLSEKEKDWLSKFNDEWLGARVRSFKKLKRYGNKGGQLHKTKKKIKECYDNNNARNRDIFGVSRATGRLFYGSRTEPIAEYEDELIDYIDNKSDDSESL